MPRKIKNVRIIQELKRLSEQSDGILDPADVVRAARHPSSPLHDSFDWDNSVAAENWRLHQARRLLNVCVEFIGGTKDLREERVFVSLSTDRVEGGYRRLVTVLSNKKLREQLLEDALEEMERFEQKYHSLKELAAIFSAMSTTRARLKKKETDEDGSV